MNSLPQSQAVSKQQAAKELLRRRNARLSLHQFIQYINPEYITSKFSETVCDALDQFLLDMMNGVRPILILGAPPQHGKSDIVSRYLPAYFFGKYPEMRVGALSYSSDLAGDMNADVQRIMTTPEYRNLFADSWLGNKPADGVAVKRNSDEFGIANHKGTYVCAGVGGPLTGKKVDLGIIDDPIKNAKEALSPTTKKSIWNWYVSTFKTRLSKNSGEIIMAIDELERPVLTDAPDTTALSITARLSRIMQRLASISVDEIASRIASGLVSRANFQNKEQTQRTYSEAFGIDLTGMLGDGAIREKMADAVRENVGLITSIQTDFINDIGEKVFGNLLEGGRSENLINIIRDRGDVTLSRAKFIARDQTSKLNAELTEARSNALGMDIYEWSGTGDERERKSHFVLNGMLCKYSDPTVYSDDGGKTWKKRSSIGAFIGKPGEDYQCRCLSLPYVSWE